MQRIINALFTLIIINALQSCLCQGMDGDEIFYYYKGGTVGLDTIRTTITRHEHKTDIPIKICYTQYSYKYKNSKNFCHDFLINGETNYMNYVSERKFDLDGASYRVYKFLYNNPDIEDEEAMYFYCQDIGIILYKSISWSGYGRIFHISGSTKKTQVAMLLGDKIMQDSSFLNTWQE